MSRQLKPITIPQGITASIDQNQVLIKSPKAELSHVLPSTIKAALDKDQLTISSQSNDRQTKALLGLNRSLINNMIIGLTQGFSKTLELQGTGYRVNPKDKGIEFSLGFSHPVVFQPPTGINLEIKDQKLITVSGADKQLVGQVAANIRQLRPPDAYKGKGVRYQGEVIKLKPGKAAKTAGEGAPA